MEESTMSGGGQRYNSQVYLKMEMRNSTQIINIGNSNIA